MTPRRVLIVAYDYPPSSSVGAVRWALMAKHLSQLGHSVSVVTSDVPGGEPGEDATEVVRPRTLESSRALRRALSRSPAQTHGTGSAGGATGANRLTGLIVPDGWAVSWAPFALRAARRLVRHRGFDCVITTSPPESTHLVGLLLGSRRPPWIADFRDGWGFEPHRGRFPTRVQRAADESLERRVAHGAEISVGATPQIADDLWQRLGARAIWIPNGWDPDSQVSYVDERSGSDDDAVVRLVYTGRLSGLWGRAPEPFLRALTSAQVGTGTPRLRLIHAGTLTSEDREAIRRSGAEGLVEHVGFLDRIDVAALQHSADALLLITSSNSSEATGKLFEYLAAGRPILALAEGNEAARIVQETRTGITVPPHDVEAIEEALGRVARGELRRDYAPTGIDRYAYPRLAQEMAEVIEEAIALKGAPSVSSGPGRSSRDGRI